MLKRQTSGSVVCPNCGRLVGVNDERCLTCGRWNPGLWGYASVLAKLGRDLGFTQIVIGGCALLYLLTLLYRPDAIRMGGLMFLAPGQEPLFLFGMSGAIPIFQYHRWWTVLSAAWLHGGLLHILFNMLWIRQLAPAVGELFGVGRLVIIYTLSSATGFALTSVLAFLPLPGPLRGAGFTLGASAPLFGLFGALYLYGRRTGNSMIRQQMLQFVVIMAIFGLLVPGIDNWAHAGGFLGGYLAARALDPMKPEQQHHLLIALGCMILMFAAIAISILDGLRYVG